MVHTEFISLEIFVSQNKVLASHNFKIEANLESRSLAIPVRPLWRLGWCLV